MEIAYVTIPELDINNWSGLDYYIAKSLENQAQLEYIGGLEDKRHWTYLLKKMLSPNKIYDKHRSARYSKDLAKQILPRIKKSADLIFSPTSFTIAHLESQKPKAFYTDATFAGMLGYYEGFSSLSPLTVKEGIEQERQALESSSIAFYSSEWAAASAVEKYGVSPAKVKVVPFGANINTCLSLDEVKSLIRKKTSEVCHVLFLGVEWKRKGGNIVLEAVKYLNETMKLPTELHILGIDNLPETDLPSYVHNYGRISKATVEGIKKIESIIAQSHFLFVPSRAEAYGLVFCEAMAFGVPPVSTATGGIPTIIKDGYNGMLLDFEAGPRSYAGKIYEVFTDKNEYERMALSAFDDYKTRLNWDVAGKTIINYLKEL